VKVLDILVDLVVNGRSVLKMILRERRQTFLTIFVWLKVGIRNRLLQTR
jgi:hypothetical protein